MSLYLRKPQKQQHNIDQRSAVRRHLGEVHSGTGRGIFKTWFSLSQSDN